MGFTEEQKLAIDTHGANLMVSAGAGSGKTAVLTERIYKMLGSGYDISRLLILTFTKLAALEMKTRIKQRVSESGKFKDQLEKIDTSFITTFDAFALSLVKKYHYLLGVSKNVTIVEEVVMSLKKREIIDNIFLNLYQEQDEHFFEMLTKFTFKSDEELKTSILKISQKLEKKPNKEKYLKSYIDDFYNDKVINEIIQTYEIECNERLKDVCFHAKELYDFASGSPLGESLNELIAYSRIHHSYDDLVSFFKGQFKLKSANKGDEEVKKLREDFSKKILDKYKTDFLKFDSIEFIKATLYETKNYVSFIIKILLKYFKEINDYKHSVNLFEFDDISMMVLDLFEQNPDVLKEVSLSFDEILLDEYQDTSDIQEEFIRKISRNNVYMVGDIKQSIYRFRNANPYIFKNKYDNYSRYTKGDSIDLGGIKIDLVKNFRSRKEVLNNINLMFKYLMTQECGDANYIAEHQMNYGNTLYDIHKMENFSYDQEYLTYTPDESKIYSNEEIEAFIIASKIKELMSSGKKVFDKKKECLREIEYKDIAIIVPRKKHVPLIEKIFTKEGIPLSIQVDDKITDSVIIKLMNSLFNLVLHVDNPNSEEYKFYFLSVARSFLSDMNDNDILKDSFSNFTENEIYQKAVLVNKYMLNNSVSKTYEYLLEVFDIYNKLIKIGDINTHLTVINYVANLIENLASYNYDFMEVAKYFEVIIDKEIEINYSKNIGASGVVLINIHKSKGLEYPICFFADLTSKFNRVDVKDSFLFDKDFGFITPYYQEGKEDTILKILYKNKYIKEDISERIRLFYVALTRAREKMYFVIPKIQFLETVSSPFMFYSYSHFISHYYDEAVYRFVKEVDYEDIVDKDYLEFSSNDYESAITKTEPIIYSDVKYCATTIDKVRISKSISELMTKQDAFVLKLGTRIHEILQTIDLIKKDYSNLQLTENETKLLSNVLNLECFSNLSKAKIYKEFEFIYNIDGKEYHGIIDLLVEYDDHFEIIDYKLSDIDKSEYVKQLNDYYKYIRSISNKDIKLYLLSITKAQLKKVPVVE